MIDTHRMDPHNRLARPRLKIRYIFLHQNFGWAIVVKADRSQITLFLMQNMECAVKVRALKGMNPTKRQLSQ